MKLLSWFILLSISGLSSSGMGLWPRPINLLVVPAHYSVLQVSFDVISRRPIILVSYQISDDPNKPILHVWNSAKWQPLSFQDYGAARFLSLMPDQVFLVGKESEELNALKTALSWRPEVKKISALNTGALINQLGVELDFGAKDWKWFAERYQLDLKDENREIREDSWYNHPFVGE
ncbi:MAG: hypothetical protein GKR87_15950 [Kiritimatiellae bacterium]|nr:hypothetical protein [Kiritimatiellia bacterium]